jgi:hypothetical protein
MIGRATDRPDCSARLITLRTLRAANGNLTVCQAGEDFPFEIKRTYFVWGVPDGMSRGAHAHRETRQVLVAAAGHLEVMVDDGKRAHVVVLDHPERGLLVEPMTWCCVRRMSSSAICLVLASTHYHESDYIHDRGEFEALIRHGAHPVH